MNIIVFAAGALLLIGSSFWQGLYQDSGTYGFVAFVQALWLGYMIWLWRKRQLSAIRGGFFVLLLPAADLLSLLAGPETMDGALSGLLRSATYACFYMLVIGTAKDARLRRLLPGVTAAAGFLLGWFGVLGGNGVAFGYADTIVNGRWAGVFQYPNTYAAVMAAFLLFSLAMLTRDKLSPRAIALYALPLVPCGAGLALSGSRGVLLAAPLAWLLALALLDARKQRRFAACTLAAAAGALAAAAGASASPAPAIAAAAAASVGVAALCAGIAQLAAGRSAEPAEPTAAAPLRPLPRMLRPLPRLLRPLPRVLRSRFALPAAAVLLGVLLALDLRAGGLVSRALPASLSERAASAGIGAATAQERLWIYRAALRLYADAPWFGGGTGVWGSRFTAYQEVPFRTAEVHSGYLERLLAVGAVGMALLAAAFAAGLRRLAAGYRLAADKALPTAAIAAIAMLLMHAAVDFDLSFGTVWLLLLWLLAAGSPEAAAASSEAGGQTDSRRDRTKRSRPLPADDGEGLPENTGRAHSQAAGPVASRLPAVGRPVGRFVPPVVSRRLRGSALLAFGLLTACTLVVSVRFFAADRVIAGWSGNLSLAEAESLYGKALGLHPGHADWPIKVANVKVRQYEASRTETTRADAVRHLTEAVAVDPRRSSLRVQASEAYERLGLRTEAVRELTEALKQDRFHAALYERLVRLEVEAASAAYNAGDPERVRLMAQSAADHYRAGLAAAQDWTAKVPADRQAAFNGRSYTVSAATRYFAATAFFLLHDYPETEALAQSLADGTNEEIAGKMTALRVVCMERTGRARLAEALLTEGSGKWNGFSDLVAGFRDIR